MGRPTTHEASLGERTSEGLVLMDWPEYPSSSWTRQALTPMSKVSAVREAWLCNALSLVAERLCDEGTIDGKRYRS